MFLSKFVTKIFKNNIMGIQFERDYLLIMLRKLSKIIAYLLGKKGKLSEEEKVYTINEGLKLLGSSIEKLRTGSMEELIAEQPRTEFLFLLHELLLSYLEDTPDELIANQDQILSEYLKDKKRDCSFLDML